MAKNSAKIVLEFEKPIVELENKIEEMRAYTDSTGIDLQDDIKRLEEKTEELRSQIFSDLTRWQRVQVARHPKRPYTLDYIERITDYWEEIYGDRAFGNDNAIIAGMARIADYSVAIIGQQKGRDTKGNLMRNFGMSNPEGYRKALRVMKMAVKFNKPIITLIDTPGAYPGLGAEERGQAEAIARNMFEMSRFPVPIICIIIGEGASGGALGIGVGDRILMMENSWYSVISPEGCAAILWRDAAQAPQAAEAMKVAPNDLMKLKVIDGIIPEPEGGAHADPDAAAESVKNAILKNLKELIKTPAEKLVEKRFNKFSQMGDWLE